MENQNKEEGFSFTYSASEQEEIKKIRQKYQPQEEDKMARLRRLDGEVTRKASVAALSIGIIGALIMGTGMSLVMTNLGEVFGLIGVIGIIFVCCAYPVYNRIVKKEREKIAPEVLRLTEELMN